MSNRILLNKARVQQPTITVPQFYCSKPSDGFNGLFRFQLEGRLIRCIASDQGGWQHVSVSIERDKRTPPCGVMCLIKDLFWDDEDCVVQFHPRKSEYVNHHPGCLHLWRCLTEKQPEPPSIMVGPK